MKSATSMRHLKGKRVLLRVDFNAPVRRGKVLDDTKIRASLPTIVWLLRKKTKVILLSHLGRPQGKRISALKMDPIARSISQILGRTVKKIDTGNWKMSERKWRSLQQRISRMHDGDIVILENTRFSPDEKKNVGAFAKQLATLGDVFILDGFAVSHRAAASIAGIPEYIPSYAGPLLEKEVAGLQNIFRGKPPFVVVLGGAKTETKLPVIEYLLTKADHILVGGAVANTCFKALGYGIRDSLVDEQVLEEARRYCKKRAKKNEATILLPMDVVVGTKDGKRHRIVTIQKEPHAICTSGEAIFDIGPETIRQYASIIKKAQTLAWNGAMGYFEQKPYHVGTHAVARLIASRAKGKAYGVIGGGETLQAMDKVQMTEHIDFLSTGGGAMLEFLAGKTLPGIAALEHHHKK